MLSRQKNVGWHDNINLSKTWNSGHVCCCYHSAQNLEHFRLQSKNSNIKMCKL